MPRSKHIARGHPDRELHNIIFDFHVRAFGEELARVNFLPVAQRKAYLTRVGNRNRRRNP
jgi:hypothetical protein